MFWKLKTKIDKFIKLSNCRTVFDYDMVIRVSCVYVNYIPSSCSHYAFRFLACADSKGKENMVDDKLRNEDTTWRHSNDEDDRVAADHHQYHKDLKH